MKQILVVALAMAAGPVFAQAPSPPAPPPARVPQAQAPAPAPAAPGEQRYQIRQLESALVNAVQHAAELMGRRIQAAAPNVVLMSDTARARGFVLPDYGVFFDVEVPGLPMSVAWSMRVINRSLDMDASLNLVRRHVEEIPDAAARREAQQALRRIELEIGAPPASAGRAARGADTVQASTVATPPSVTPPPAAAPPALPEDPNEAYTTEVKDALISAMLDYSRPMSIAPDQWLTIAARDAQGPLFPGEAYDAMTIVLRIKGSDLAALYAERITRAEARKRVEVREF